MKSHLILLPLLSVALAVPAPGADAAIAQPVVELPEGWTRIASSEVKRHLELGQSDSSNDSLEKREPGEAFLCTEPDFEGECATVKFLIENTCEEIPEPFAYNLGSFAPEKGALCRVTAASVPDACDLHGDLFVENPGYPNLYDIDGRDVGSLAHHILCQECTNCQGTGSK